MSVRWLIDEPQPVSKAYLEGVLLGERWQEVVIEPLRQLARVKIVTRLHREGSLTRQEYVATMLALIEEEN